MKKRYLIPSLLLVAASLSSCGVKATECKYSEAKELYTKLKSNTTASASYVKTISASYQTYDTDGVATNHKFDGDQTEGDYYYYIFEQREGEAASESLLYKKDGKYYLGSGEVVIESVAKIAAIGYVKGLMTLVNAFITFPEESVAANYKFYTLSDGGLKYEYIMDGSSKESLTINSDGLVTNWHSEISGSKENYDITYNGKINKKSGL